MIVKINYYNCLYYDRKKGFSMKNIKVKSRFQFYASHKCQNVEIPCIM